MNNKIIIYLVTETGYRPLPSAGSLLYRWLIDQQHLEIVVADSKTLDPGGAMEPDVLLFETSRRGVISLAVLNELRNRFPLALVIELTGSWCQGDTRSGYPLPIPLRFAEGVAPQRIMTMLESCDVFYKFREQAIPLASGRDLFQLWNSIPMGQHSGELVNVVSQDKHERTSIRDMLCWRGYRVQCFSVIQWNRNPASTGTAIRCIVNRSEIAELVWGHGIVPDILIASHLNQADRDMIDSSGCMEFLIKPFVSLDLMLLLANGKRRTRQQVA